MLVLDMDRGVPFNRSSPKAGFKRPQSISKNVDLPQPEGPTMATNSPGNTEKDI